METFQQIGRATRQAWHSVRYPGRAYDDKEVTFFLHCRGDPNWLELALAALRRAYPEPRVIVVSDGDSDPRLGRAAAQHGAEFTYEPQRMFLKEYGGQITQRMLAAFLAKPTRWLVKIDTDTKVCRRVSRLPAGRCLFGRRQKMGPLISLQGGIVGYTLEAAKALYQSSLLTDPELAKPERTWARGNQFLQQYVSATGRTSTDWTLGYCAGRLGIPMINHAEMQSAWGVPLPDNGQFAIIHPAQEMYDCPER